MRFSKVYQSGSSLPRYTFKVDLTSPIGVKWSALGAERTTGRAVGDPTPLDDGIGLIQLFMQGAIFWSPGFGAVYMSERTWLKWSSPSVEKRKTAGGETIQGYLGYPVEDTHRQDTPAGLREWTWFERGMVYAGPEGSWVVQGEIYGHYRELGGLTGTLGPPVSDELGAPGHGRVAHFARGDIYLHARTGVREVHGAIRQRYLELGGPASALGYPTSDESSLRGTSGEIGRFNRFEFGSGIYFSGSTGAWEVYGAIWAEWQRQGGVAGKLGLPTSGETDTPTSGGRYNEFEHGVMLCHDGGPYSGTWSVLDLQLLIESYTVNEDFNVQVHVTATPGQVNHGRMPADGEFDAGVKAFEPPLVMVDVATVRADSVLTAWLLAISENVVGKDDRMGTVTATYGIDNFWGLFDADFRHTNAAFTAVIRVAPRTRATVTDPHALFWPFENTSTPSLTWETFAETFRDVKATDKHLNFNPFDLNVHPWEIFLYAVFYNGLAAGGSCFGMCLAAIYAREQASVYLEPIRDQPFNPYQRNHRMEGKVVKKLNADVSGDAGVLDEINVKHGYQMGAGMVEFFLSRWMAGALHDPERAYRESYADFQAGNWPLLTISDEDAFSQDHGHAVLPYEWVPTPDRIATWPPRQPLIIYVKNPNFPQAARDDVRCRIEIDRLTWKWTFQFDTNETWRGSGVTGGRLLAIPFTELNARPVTPGSTVLELIAAGVMLVLGGAAETHQITDGYGRTFFVYPRAAGHRLEAFEPAPVKAINWDRDTAIPNLMQVPAFGSSQTTAQATGTVIGQGGGLPLQSAASEWYYHRPGPPPRGASRLVQANLRYADCGLTSVGSGRQAATADVVQALSSAPQDALHFQLKGTGHGQMRWTVASPRMSATVLASMEPGVVDSIHLGGTGGHFQSVTLQFPQATRIRTVSLTVSGWRGDDRAHARSFVLEGLAMDNTDSVHAQITDGGSELILDNPGGAKTFTLRLVAGPQALTVAERLNVPLDGASKIRLRPSTWSVTATSPMSIHLDALDPSGRKILRTSQL